MSRLVDDSRQAWQGGTLPEQFWSVDVRQACPGHTDGGTWPGAVWGTLGDNTVHFLQRDDDFIGWQGQTMDKLMLVSTINASYVLLISIPGLFYALGTLLNAGGWIICVRGELRPDTRAHACPCHPDRFCLPVREKNLPAVVLTLWRNAPVYWWTSPVTASIPATVHTARSPARAPGNRCGRGGRNRFRTRPARGRCRTGFSLPASVNSARRNARSPQRQA